MEKVAADYPPGNIVKGVVRNLTNYGAFIEIDEGIDGLLHVTDMSWTRKVTHPSEMVDKGQEIECKVLSVDQQRRFIGLKQMQDDPWTADIPDRYVDDVVHGTITKITNFGVFVGLEDGLEGLLHISELSDDKVENAEELVQVGDPIDVKILRVDIEERKSVSPRNKSLNPKVLHQPKHRQLKHQATAKSGCRLIPVWRGCAQFRGLPPSPPDAPPVVGSPKCGGWPYHSGRDFVTLSKSIHVDTALLGAQEGYLLE